MADWPAIISPLLGAPIGALITIWAQRSTSSATLASQREISSQTIDAQRKLASDHRLWEKRAAIYPPIIQKLQQRNVFMTQQQARTEEGATYSDEHQKYLASLVTDMRAWPSEGVMGRWATYFYDHKIYASMSNLYVMAEKHDALGEDTKQRVNEWIILGSAYVTSLATDLINEMQAELHGEPLPESMALPRPPAFKGDPDEETLRGLLKRATA